MFCNVLHSARYSARHSARPQNAVNTIYFLKKDNIVAFSVSCPNNANPMVFTAFCGGALYRALCVHCAKHAVCAILLLEAHSLFVGSSCDDESVSRLGFGECKREFDQACVCTAIKQKKSCASLFAG